MDKNESKTLTQDELVAMLHELGYTDVTKRRVALWRENDVLPSFDIIGSGRGRQRGRESSAWSDREAVLNQAVQVYELLKVYKTFGELYLPLWMCSYKVPLERVRKALTSPLETAVQDADIKVDGRNAVEDEIDDAAHLFSGFFEHSNLKFFGVPPEALAALLNVVINNEYDLEDQPFLDGKEALQEFDQTVQESCAEMFGDDVASKVSQSRPTDTMWTILTHAPFINKHLTVQHLKEALDRCTFEDLATVQRDLQVLHEIILVFKPMIEILMPFMPGAPKTFSGEGLVPIYNAGKVLIWVDISLRQHGYGVWVDNLLATVLRESRKDINEEAKKDLAEAGPHIAVAMETFFAQLGVPLNGQEGVSPQ